MPDLSDDGEWTAELEWLFGQKEYQYWEEQQAQYINDQIEYFDNDEFVSTESGLVKGADEADEGAQWLHDEIDAALDRDIERAAQRDSDLLIVELDADAARQERERQALQQLDEELEKADEQTKQDNQKKDNNQGSESSTGKDGHNAQGDTGDPGKPDKDPSQPVEVDVITSAGMPTDSDDYVGVTHRFWGGGEPIDPTDKSDQRRAVKLTGGTVPIEPWDSYDGIGAVGKRYGGDDPLPAWEKIGPLFRPTSAGAGEESS